MHGSNSPESADENNEEEEAEEELSMDDPEYDRSGCAWRGCGRMFYKARNLFVSIPHAHSMTLVDTCSVTGAKIISAKRTVPTSAPSVTTSVADT